MIQYEYSIGKKNVFYSSTQLITYNGMLKDVVKLYGGLIKSNFLGKRGKFKLSLGKIEYVKQNLEEICKTRGISNPINIYNHGRL